jgi:serine/threonine-protein kinase
VSWRGKSDKPGAGRTFQAPPGFRDSPQPAVAIGEVISSAYSVRREVARTETGAVFECWDMLFERPVALKLAWRDPGTPSLVAEARRCAAVDDPGAVTTFAAGNHRGVEYVVAERVEGVAVRAQVSALVATGESMPAADILQILQRVSRAVAAAHRAKIALGEVSGETVLVTSTQRTVLGRLSMSQVPAVGADEVCWAPEAITGQRSPSDPTAAAAIDIYGIGCVAVELATCHPPFQGENLKATLMGHVHSRIPQLSEIRTDLPVELADLVSELLAKQPQMRPASADAVVAQLESIAERAAATRRVLRVLVVDHDQDRVRELWSVIRRAHPRATVDAATDGHDAAQKLRRDRPDVVMVDTRLGGSMNALELFMYVGGLEEARGTTLVALADQLDPRDAAVFTQMGVLHTLVRDPRFHDSCGTLIRKLAAAARFGRAHGRITVSG